MNKLFSLFQRVPGTLTRRRRRNSVDLFGVEHMCDEHLRAFQADLFRARLSINVNDRATIGILRTGNAIGTGREQVLGIGSSDDVETALFEEKTRNGI